MPARLRVLGSGTSTGVPMLGCACAVCVSADPRDRRLRPSILLRHQGQAALIDTSPDFRAQALAARLERLDAVLFTHSHADHIFGMDDIRQLNAASGGAIPIHADRQTLADLRRVFQYVFANNYEVSAIPRVAAHEIPPAPPGGGARPPIAAAGLEFEPIEVLHGALPITAYRFGASAYVTDFSVLPPPAMARLRGLDLLILDALRRQPHPTHSSLANSLRLVEELAPRRALFTHICHDLPHAATEASLPPHVRLAYDGLELDLEI